MGGSLSQHVFVSSMARRATHTISMVDTSDKGGPAHWVERRDEANCGNGGTRTARIAHGHDFE